MDVLGAGREQEAHSVLQEPRDWELSAKVGHCKNMQKEDGRGEKEGEEEEEEEE